MCCTIGAARVWLIVEDFSERFRIWLSNILAATQHGGIEVSMGNNVRNV